MALLQVRLASYSACGAAADCGPPPAVPFRKRALELLVQGIGLAMDYYDLTIVNLVRAPLEEEYPVTNFDSSWQKTFITSSTLIGAVVGQLVLGALADKLGRRRLLLLSGALTFVGSAACACSFNFGGPGSDGLWASLVFWRFVLGVGVGGEYPLSAAQASEHAGAHASGTRLCLVFSFTMVGSVLSSALVYLCRLGGMRAEVLWRFAFAFGALLSAITFGLRFYCSFDSQQFKRSKSGAVDADVVTAPKPPLVETLRVFWKPLLGTAGSWMLYDIVNYGLGLYSSDLVKGFTAQLGGGDTGNAAGVLIVNLFALPGGLLAAYALPRIGRKRTMQVGTLCMLLCFIVLAGSPKGALSPGLSLALFGLQSLAGRMGPGTMTYLIPGEIFPVKVRATCHGISAASGKVGAVFGSMGFGLLLAQAGLRATCGLSAGLCVALLAHSQAFLPNYSEATLHRLEETQDDGDGDAAVLRLLYATR